MISQPVKEPILWHHIPKKKPSELFEGICAVPLFTFPRDFPHSENFTFY